MKIIGYYNVSTNTLVLKDNVTTKTKQCSKYEEIKPLSEFHRRSRNKNGLVP